MKAIRDNEKIGYTTTKGTYYMIWKREKYLFCIGQKAIKQKNIGYKLVETLKPVAKVFIKN